jgi:CDP-diacylglycerol--glycerol-3-phosphate 3-phosphatidyltransferase
MSVAAGGPRPMLDRRSLNVPNLITVMRLALALVLFMMIGFGGSGSGLPAAVVFLIAASTDALDGYIARRYGLVTTLGRILDPFADKIIICGAFIFLLEKSPQSGVTAWMVMIVVGREMFITVLRSFLEQQGQDFSAKWSGKIKMVLQCAAVTASLLSLSAAPDPALVGARDVLLWLAVAATIYSGLAYIIRAVKLTSA